MLKFLNKSVMQTANATCNLANVLITNTKNHKPDTDIDIGFAAKISLQ